MATIATLSVDLVAHTKKFVLPEKGVQSFARQVDNAASSVKALAAGLGVGLSAGAVVAMTKATIKSVDALNDQAASLGVSVLQLSQLHHAALLAGVGVEAFDKSLGTLNRKLVGAEDDGGAAAQALETLGLSAQRLLAESPADALNDIADGFQRIQNPSQRAALAFQLFGKEGINMTRMLSDGRKGLADAAKEADRLGVSISDIDAAKIAMVDDAFVRLNASFTGLGRTVVAQVSPALSALADDMARLVGEQNKLTGKSSIQGWAEGAAKWLARAGEGAKFVANSAQFLSQSVVGIGFKLGGTVNETSRLMGKNMEEAAGQTLNDAARNLKRLFGDTAAQDAQYFFDDATRSANNAAQDVVNSTKAQQSALVGLGKEQRKLADSIQGTIDRLREQVATFGMSAEQIEIWKLQQQGADAGTIAMASSLANQIEKLREAADAQKQMADEAARLNEQFQSPMSKYEGTISRLGELLNNGAISWDVYGSAVRQAREELERTSRASERRGREVGRADIFRRAAASLPEMPTPNAPIAEIPGLRDFPDIFRRAAASLPEMPTPNAPIAEIPGLRGNFGVGKKIEVKGQDKMLDLLEQIHKGVVANQNIILG